MTDGKWWQRAWSLVDGCSPVSLGCEHCWLRAGYRRWDVAPNTVVFRTDRLELPLTVKKPTVWAIWSDLFHERVHMANIQRAFEVMELARQHTFVVLTKRHARMLDFTQQIQYAHEGGVRAFGRWPLPNVCLAVTVENAEAAWQRIPALLSSPAAVRLISAEPLLGPLTLWRWLKPPLMPDRVIRPGSPPPEYIPVVGLDGVIAGAETGPGARPVHPAWVRGLRDECLAAETPFWFKSWGEWAPGDTLPHMKTTELLGKRSHTWQDKEISYRVGHKNAGRFLDGRTWDGWPEINRHRLGGE